MGVRGLTTYIAKKAEKFLTPYELHDCDLVIDGDNLASQIFNRMRFTAFGGNYDEYFRLVCDFFHMLAACHVTPYVLLDGGYENRKMRTVKARLQTRIAAVKHAHPLGNHPIMPLFLREVFVDALRACKVAVMRCFFEADDELAILARKLNCPVLSYDSDFYIYNVQYVPFVTLNRKVYRKTLEDENNFEVEVLDAKGRRTKKGRGRKVVVREKGKRETELERAEEYCYLDCCLYTLENLVGRGSLKAEMMPLFATLLGNDFIQRRTLKKFYSKVRLRKVGRVKNSPQQRRIAVIFEWLKGESLQSALRKISESMKLSERDALLKQIRTAMGGYNSEKSSAFEYFGFQAEGEAAEPEIELDLDFVETQEGEEEAEGSDEGLSESEDEEDEPEPEPEEAVCEDPAGEPEFPSWFADLYRNAELPRCLVDMYASNRYVNYPQVEDMSLPDSNEIAYPILLYIYALIHAPEKPPTLHYMTRVSKYARWGYKRFDAADIPTVTFDPASRPGIVGFLDLFASFLNRDEIFVAIETLPPNLRLYFLAAVFWLHRSKYAGSVHLQSLLLCLTMLTIVDKRCGHVRDETRFKKNHGKTLAELKEKFREQNAPDTTITDLPKLAKHITKHESLLAMETLIHCFSVSEKFERKHSDFSRAQMHVFAEFQAVVFFLNALAPLLGGPFEAARMGDCYNGFFVYNMCANLRTRADPLAYVRTHLLRFAPNVRRHFEVMFEFVRRLVPQLERKDQALTVTRAKVKKNVAPNPKKAQNSKILENDCVEGAADHADESEKSDMEEFEDLNNQFCQLLKMK